jgi:hypothetical protein
VTGTAPERTRLAWTRTLLTGTVVAVLAVRLALHSGLSAWGAGGAGVVALGWVLLVTLVHSRFRALDRRPAPGARRAPAQLAIIVLGYAVLAIGLVVLP